MSHSIFHNPKTGVSQELEAFNFSLVYRALKIEQAEVSLVFELKTAPADFESLLSLASKRALKAQLVLSYYGDLFQIRNPSYTKSLGQLESLHTELKKEALANDERKFLRALCLFTQFSDEIQKCFFIITNTLEKKLDMNPKNNLMIRYLENLKIAIKILRERTLLESSSLRKNLGF